MTEQPGYMPKTSNPSPAQKRKAGKRRNRNTRPTTPDSGPGQPDLTPTDGVIPCSDVDCPVCQATAGETCHGEGGAFVPSHEDRCRDAQTTRLALDTDDDCDCDPDDPDCDCDDPDDDTAQPTLPERARAAMAAMGVYSLTDAEWGGVSPSLTAAAAFIGSASTCVYCRSIIGAGEPRYLLRVPRLPQPQQFHEHCAVTFASTPGAPAFARGGAV